jgi:hypothetical protein
MNARTATVIKGFNNLTQSEKNEFIAEINKIIEGGEPALEHFRKSIVEGSMTISLGPVKGGCPCCGR